MNKNSILEKIESLESILVDWKKEYKDEQIALRKSIFKSLFRVFSTICLLSGLVYTSLQIISYYNKKSTLNELRISYKETAMQLYEEGRYYAALAVLSKLLEADREDNEILSLISNIKIHSFLIEYSDIENLNEDNLRELESVYGEIIYLKRKNPGKYEPYLFLSLYYIITKDYIAAENNILEALKIDPENGYLLSRYAYILLKQENIDCANKAIIKALKSQNKNKFIYHINGLIKTRLKDYEESKKSYEKVLLMDPYYAPALYNLAFYYLYRSNPKNVEKAKKLLLEEFRIYPNKTDSIELLAGVYQQNKEYEISLLLYNYILSKNPNKFSTIRAKAIIYRDMGEFDRSLELFQKLIELNPFNISEYYKDIVWEIYRVKKDLKMTAFYLKKASKFNQTKEIIDKTQQIDELLKKQ